MLSSSQLLVSLIPVQPGCQKSVMQITGKKTGKQEKMRPLLMCRSGVNTTVRHVKQGEVEESLIESVKLGTLVS